MSTQINEALEIAITGYLNNRAALCARIIDNNFYSQASWYKQSTDDLCDEIVRIDNAVFNLMGQARATMPGDKGGRE